ncbi:MAG: acyl-CoA dehydrogenase family protein [Pseudomonadota bacterium]
MDFGLSEEQRMLQDSVTGYLAAHCELQVVRDAAESAEAQVPALAAGLMELGVTGILIPGEYGGVNMGGLEAALVAEALGYFAAPVAYVASSVMAPLALQRAGSPAQKEEWLPQLAAGECVAGVGVTEQIGRRQGDGVQASGGRLSGEALFVLDVDGADLFFLADQQGLLYVVAAADVEITRLRTIDRTRSVAAISMQDTPAQVLPGSSESPQALHECIAMGRVMLAADTLGAAQKMLDDSVAYAKERKQFERVIGSFQAVKHMCAEMAAELEPCRALVWYAAHAQSAVPADAQLMACQTKAHLAEVGRMVARTATEVHGGMGMTDLLGLHYWFKRIGVNRQLLGAPELVREEAAQVQGWC